MTTPRFPRYDLDSSIEVVRTMQQNGVGGEGTVATGDEVAAWLKYKSANNGAFLSRLASARLFGLLEGSTGELAITARARDILDPVFPEQEARARLDAFKDVPLFRQFLEMFGGKPLPDRDGIRNALKRQFLIDDDRKLTMAEGRLLDSAEQAGLFSNGPERMIVPTLNLTTHHEENFTERGTTQASRHSRTLDAPGSTSVTPTLVKGLIEQLPSPGGSWTSADLERWLDLARLVLGTVYLDERPRPVNPNE